MDTTIEGRPPAVEDYRRLRDALGWDPVPRDAAAEAMTASRVAVTAVDDGETVGCGRIIGDGLYFYLQDVIVHPDRQGEGIGAALTERLLAYVEAEAPEQAFVGLMAATGAASFYEQYGFEPRGPGEPGMVLDR